MSLILASIPSPPINHIPIGPFRLTFYGLFIGTGVALAWWLAKRRFEQRDGDLLEQVLIRVVIYGFIGARIAYVSTHLPRFEGEWWRVIAIWEGGLALFGGLTGGAIALFFSARSRGLDVRRVLDSLAPAVPLAQAVGRWGNYFNQELFGTPTNLPWAIEIDPGNRPVAYQTAETFHPTFLYESLWNLALAGFIIGISQRKRQLDGRLIGIYFMGYGMIRFLLELIRTDTTFRFLGLSRNGWVSIAAIGIGAAVLARRPAADVDSAT